MPGRRNISRPRGGCDSSKLPDPIGSPWAVAIEKLDYHSVLIFDTFVGFPEDCATTYGLRTEWWLPF